MTPKGWKQQRQWAIHDALWVRSRAEIPGSQLSRKFTVHWTKQIPQRKSHTMKAPYWKGLRAVESPRWGANGLDLFHGLRTGDYNTVGSPGRGWWGTGPGVPGHLRTDEEGGQDAAAREEKAVVGQRTLIGRRAGPVKWSLREGLDLG